MVRKGSPLPPPKADGVYNNTESGPGEVREGQKVKGSPDSWGKKRPAEREGGARGGEREKKGGEKGENIFKALVSERVKEEAESVGPQMRYVGRQGVGALQATCWVHTALLLSVTNSLGSSLFLSLFRPLSPCTII